MVKITGQYLVERVNILCCFFYLLFLCSVSAFDVELQISKIVQKMGCRDKTRLQFLG